MQPRQPRTPLTVEYNAIVRAHVDRHGNLRLYRRQFLWTTQVVFHPRGEWSKCSVDWFGHAIVQLSR